MFKRSRTTELKARAAGGKDLAVALAQDRKFRKQLLSAIRHGEFARRRAARKIGPVAVVRRFAADQKLIDEVRRMTDDLQKAIMRVDKKRSHRLRNSLIFVGAGGAVAVVVPQSRRWLSEQLGLGSSFTPRVITES